MNSLDDEATSPWRPWGERIGSQRLWIADHWSDRSDLSGGGGLASTDGYEAFQKFLPRLKLPRRESHETDSSDTYPYGARAHAHYSWTPTRAAWRWLWRPSQWRDPDVLRADWSVSSNESAADTKKRKKVRRKKLAAFLLIGITSLAITFGVCLWMVDSTREVNFYGTIKFNNLTFEDGYRDLLSESARNFSSGLCHGVNTARKNISMLFLSI